MPHITSIDYQLVEAHVSLLVCSVCLKKTEAQISVSWPIDYLKDEESSSCKLLNFPFNWETRL